MMRRMSVRLNLTADQQAKAKSIFGKARVEQRALGPKLREEHIALRAAVKTDNEGQIDRILQQNSQLNTQTRAIHTKAVAEFYQILTPAQKTQFDHMFAHRSDRPGRHQSAQRTSTSESR